MKTVYCFLVFTSALLVSIAEAGPLQTYLDEGEINVHQQTLQKMESLMESEIIQHLQAVELGKSPQCPAESCDHIAKEKPYSKSGYYWVKRPYVGPTGVYCEMDGDFQRDGGWMRVASVDMSTNTSNCPPGLDTIHSENKTFCRKPSTQVPGCSSSFFSVFGVKYSKVCGKVIGYQYWQPNGFGPNRFNTAGINGLYIDGVSITRGSPREHIWSMAAVYSETYHRFHEIATACPCMNFGTTFRGSIPSFVGNDYYCETGSRDTYYEAKYYFDDPLWDGKGCTGANQCCERGGPWFCKELAESTTDDIEVRVCGNEVSVADDDPAIVQIQLYIQ